jgi:hypothetical protein
LGLAGNEDGGSSGAFAGLVGKNVKNGSDRAVGDDNTENYAGKGSKKNNESN